MRNSLAMEFKAVASNVAVARIAVATFAISLDFALEDIEEIKVAVSEAVSNAVLHAYPNGEGSVRVEAVAEEDRLRLSVCDSGVGMEDTDKAKEVGYSTLKGHMGLGFSFMESFMDEFYLSSSKGDGTTVRMVKKRWGD